MPDNYPPDYPQSEQVPEDELLLRELHERRKASQAACDHHRMLLSMHERIVEMTSASINACGKGAGTAVAYPDVNYQEGFTR